MTERVDNPSARKDVYVIQSADSDMMQVLHYQVPISGEMTCAMSGVREIQIVLDEPRANGYWIRN